MILKCQSVQVESFRALARRAGRMNQAHNVTILVPKWRSANYWHSMPAFPQTSSPLTFSFVCRVANCCEVSRIGVFQCKWGLHTVVCSVYRNRWICSDVTDWFKKMDSISYVYISWTMHGMWGHAVAQLVEALRYKPEGRGFDSQLSHWNFSLT